MAASDDKQEVSASDDELLVCARGLCAPREAPTRRGRRSCCMRNSDVRTTHQAERTTKGTWQHTGGDC